MARGLLRESTQPLVRMEGDALLQRFTTKRHFAEAGKPPTLCEPNQATQVGIPEFNPVQGGSKTARSDRCSLR